MKHSLLLRALTAEQRALVVDLANSFGLLPDDWHHAPALRECVEQLACANTVERIQHNPRAVRRSERVTWLRAAQLLGLSPGTPFQRRARARASARTAATTDMLRLPGLIP